MKERMQEWLYNPAREQEGNQFKDFIHACAIRNRIGAGPWFSYADDTFGMVLDCDIENEADSVDVSIKYPANEGTTAMTKEIFDYFGAPYMDTDDLGVYYEHNDHPRDESGVEIPFTEEYYEFGLDHSFMPEYVVDTRIEIAYRIPRGSEGEAAPCEVRAYFAQTYTFYEKEHEDHEFPEHDCAAFFMKKIFDYYNEGDSDEDLEEENAAYLPQ